jgi:hypothetical protein
LDVMPCSLLDAYQQVGGMLYQTTQCHISAYGILRSYHSKNLNSQLTSWMWVWCISGWLLYKIPIWWLGLMFKFPEACPAPRYFCCTAVS